MLPPHEHSQMEVPGMDMLHQTLLARPLSTKTHRKAPFHLAHAVVSFLPALGSKHDKGHARDSQGLRLLEQGNRGPRAQGREESAGAGPAPAPATVCWPNSPASINETRKNACN